MSNIKEIYTEAKKALNASAPDRLIGRNKESEEISDQLIRCFKEKNAVSLYVNGQPGTGKTFSVNNLLDDLYETYKFKKIVINCMSVKNIQNLYKIILNELETFDLLDSNLASITSKRISKENLLKAIENTITTMKIHIILVLDEIDQIEVSMKGSADIYRIFELPHLTYSKLILIGIANSLDFTDRLLPRLDLKPEFKPIIIKFLPYSKEDIINIIKERLRNVKEMNNNISIIDDRALMLCASKVASTNGDIRKVLDICRRGIEFNERESSEKMKTVDIAQMMRIFNEVNPITSSNLDKNAMPLMQKILLCTILLCNKEMKIKEVGLSKLFDKFNKICKTYSTAIESESEFVNLCTCVQDNGLLDIKKAKEIRNYKVCLKIDEQELKDKLQDETFMNEILTNKIYK